MELAATAPVADAVGLEAEGSYLQRKDACTECMERPCRHKHEVAFLYRDAAPIALAYRVVCCGCTQSPDIVCRRSEDDGRTRICRQDVPGLRLLVVVLMCLGIRLIGMYLHGEVLGSIHREHLHDARIACTLPMISSRCSSMSRSSGIPSKGPPRPCSRVPHVQRRQTTRRTRHPPRGLSPH